MILAVQFDLHRSRLRLLFCDMMNAGQYGVPRAVRQPCWLA